ncbi:MAG: TonB-dependent receptor [Gemmatimonadota bacterium]
MISPRRLTFSLSLLLFSTHPLLAQETGRVTGTVVSEAGDPMSGATVSVVRGRQGTVTDAQGAYTLELLPGNYTLQARFIGFRPDTVSVTVQAGAEVSANFTLTSDPLGMQELVVTATRAVRTQKEATLSMQVVSAERIEKFQPQSVAEVLRTVPGIHAEEGGGEVAVNSFIRGLPSPGQFRYQTLQEDGMPVRSIPNVGGSFSAVDVFFRQDLNIRTLEVAKGGASTLFGINAPGGIINYISKTGGDFARSTVRLTGAQKDYYRVDFNTNGPISEDWRFNLGGFYRFDRGPRISGLDTRGLQLKGNITRLLDQGHMRLYFKYIDDQVQFLLPFAFRRGSEEPAIDDSDGTQNSDEADDILIPTPDGKLRGTMDRAVMTKGATVMFEYFSEFGDGWSVENKTRWMDYEHEFNIFIPFRTASADAFAEEFMEDPLTDRAVYSFATDPGVPISPEAVYVNGAWARFRPTEDLANQITLKKRVDAGTSQHVFSLGAYLSRTELTDNQIRPTTLHDGTSTRPKRVDLRIVNAAGDTTRVTSRGILEASNNFLNRDVLSNEVAIFGGDEITINDRLRIDIGGRFERQTATTIVEGKQGFDLTQRALEIGFDPQDTLFAQGDNAVFGNGQFARRQIEFDDFGVAVGFNYAANEFVNAYGNFSRGFAFPEVTFLAGDVALDDEGNIIPVPEPEENEEFLQAEGGVRWATSQFSGSAAGFWVRINNRTQTDIRIIRGQSVQVSEDVGDTRTFGVEATAAFSPLALPGVTVEANWTYQDHELEGFISGGEDFSGNEVKRIPNFMFTNNLLYSRYGFDFLLSWSHLGDRFGDDANNQVLENFDVLTADAGYTIPIGEGRSLRLGVNVYNLTDSDGLTEGDPRLPPGADPADLPFFNARPILPQRFKFTASYSF